VLIIGVMIVTSVTLDFVQEYRAGEAAERLQASVAVHTSVIRDGVAREVPVSEVVPGDLVVLSAGDLVPADGRILEARDCFVNQALLTGEPYPVEKRATTTLADAGDGADAIDRVFMGTSVVSGSAKVGIERTGANTTFGEIAQALSAKAPPTAFEH